MHVFSTQELIGMTSGTGISGVLKYIWKSNINITTSNIWIESILNRRPVIEYKPTFLGRLLNLILSNHQLLRFSYGAIVLAYAQFRDNKPSKHSLCIQILELIFETYKVNADSTERHTVFRSRLLIITPAIPNTALLWAWNLSPKSIIAYLKISSAKESEKVAVPPAL